MGRVDLTRMRPVFHRPIGVWRVPSGQVNKLLNVADRVGSGEEVFKSHGSGRVGSTAFQI